MRFISRRQSAKRKPPRRSGRGGWLKCEDCELRNDQTNDDAAVAQTAFRRAVVGNRLAGVAAFDRDTRRIDAMARDEIVTHGFGPAAVEIGLRSRGLAVIRVADDDGRRARLLLHAE